MPTPPQRPFFLTSLFAAFRQQAASPAKSHSHAPPNGPSTPATARPLTTAAAAAAAAAATSSSSSSPSPHHHHHHPHHHHHQQQPQQQQQQQQQQQPQAQAQAQTRSTAAGALNQRGLHSPRLPGGMAIPGQRRGSDSSSEGFREVRAGERWYIGGRTAAGEEKFFRLGVMRRSRSGDSLSLDRLSL